MSQIHASQFEKIVDLIDSESKLVKIEIAPAKEAKPAFCYENVKHVVV